MSTQAITVDPSQVQSITVDPSEVTAAAKTAKPDRFAQDRATTEAWAQNHPILGPIARFLVAGGQNAANAITDTPGQLYHAIVDPPTLDEAGLPPEQRLAYRLGGKQVIEAGQDYASGKVTPKAAASVLPEALGTGVGQVAGGAVYGKAGDIGAEVLPPVADAVTDAAKAIPGKVSGAARAIRNVTPKQAAAVAGGAAGATGGAHIPGFQTSGGIIGAAVGAERAAALAERMLGERANAPIFPKKVASAAPGASAADDLEGVTSRQTESAGEVNEVEPPVPPAAPAAEEPAATPTAAAPSAAAPKVTPKAVEQQLETALGGKKLVPGVSLRNQPAAQSAAVGELPEGFTATPDSSLLKGYKYDPAKQEFNAVLNNGQTYTHGEVTPDQVKAFEDADSQGSAWTKNIKQGPGTVLVKKNGASVIKTRPVTDLAQQIKDSAEPSQAPVGKPLTDLGKQIKTAAKRTVVTDPETGAPEFSDVIAAKKTQPAAPPAEAAAAPAEDAGDLTSLLQKSVDKVVAQPGGVFTSAVPKDLLDRWGVDPESFTEGRSQTRGMSPDETAASIKKLTAAYKKGQPVEPVMETRDAANNITDVDGRGRALAAHRAGVERIPVIVRRMPTAQ